jgi:hypothetical protein
MDQEVKEDNSTLERYLIARETPEVVFWQQRGAIRATSPPSLKTCGLRVISTFFLYISFMYSICRFYLNDELSRLTAEIKLKKTNNSPKPRTTH